MARTCRTWNDSWTEHIFFLWEHTYLHAGSQKVWGTRLTGSLWLSWFITPPANCVPHTSLLLKGSFDISPALILESLTRYECRPWSLWKSGDIWLNTRFLPDMKLEDYIWLQVIGINYWVSIQAVLIVCSPQVKGSNPCLWNIHGYVRSDILGI